MPVAPPSADGEVMCPNCRRKHTVTLFPAFYRNERSVSDLRVVFEGDAACYYDPEKKAVAVCDDCGRFISEFHRVAISPEHTTCLACLSEGRTPSNETVTQRERTVYDNLALALAVVPPLTCIGLYFMIFTAPAALYVVLRYWKKGPNSIIPRSRYRFVIAGIIALLELVAMVAFVYWAFQSATSNEYY